METEESRSHDRLPPPSSVDQIFPSFGLPSLQGGGIQMCLLSLSTLVSDYDGKNKKKKKVKKKHHPLNREAKSPTIDSVYGCARGLCFYIF
jgi:hypothetical protein